MRTDDWEICFLHYFEDLIEEQEVLISNKRVELEI